MKKLIPAFGVVFLLGCAGSSGVMTGNHYVDNSYPVEFSFPEIYKVYTQSEHSRIRVTAISLKYGKVTTTVSPQFIISVAPGEKSFEEFVSDEQNVHFEPELFYNYEVIRETNWEIKDFKGKLLYYKSMTMFSNDNNLGIKGFLNCGKFYVKIEYIANKAWYGENEFNEITETMTVKK